jgi:flagellar biosynthesis protein FliQ
MAVMDVVCIILVLYISRISVYVVVRKLVLKFLPKIILIWILELQSTVFNKKCP